MRSIVITGGSKGIGKAIVRRFAQAGFRIFTCSRNAADLQALRHEIQTDFPAAALHFLPADLSQKKQVKTFADFVQGIENQIDVLVNNTGYFLPGQIHNEPEGTLESMIETNVYSAYHLTRLFLPGMMARREGYVFNICSTASITAYTQGGSYCISKFALLGMTKVLREELKPHGIRVTAILPGATLTASWEGVDLPPERFMKPEDVADSLWAAYSLSPNSVVEEILIRPQLGDL
jgi:short-subunit dehydrogenase